MTFVRNVLVESCPAKPMDVFGGLQMNEDHGRGSNLVDTTDCLEAVGVFRAWKNFLFSIVFIGLLLVQGIFWLVNTEIVQIPAPSMSAPNSIAARAEYSKEPDKQAADFGLSSAAGLDVGRLSSRINLLTDINFEHLARAVRISNGVLVITATLYCLVMLFSLQMSLTARLGGVHHISQAFFLSLVMLVLLIPWQQILGSGVIGALYRPDELTAWLPSKSTGILSAVLYYLRFCGCWAVVMLLLVLSQLRSRRWYKAVVRRLEII
jgi:hypothetical protein